MPHLALACLLLATVTGCSTPPPPSTPTGHPAKDRTEPAARPSATDDELLDAEPEAGRSGVQTEAPGQFQPLPVDDHEAVLWVPRGDEPRPLLLIAHGAGGGPEWHCDFWAQTVGEHAFVLCVRGRAIREGEYGFYFPEHQDLGRRLRAALASFEAAHGGRATQANVYVAYSQGATMGALVLPELASALPRVLLIEGGYEQWPVVSARRFAEAGGKRVFFACGTRGCDRGAKRSVQWLDKGGVEAAGETAQGAGHTPAGDVGEMARRGLVWLVRDDPSWSDFELAPTASQ